MTARTRFIFGARLGFSAWNNSNEHTFCIQKAGFILYYSVNWNSVSSMLLTTKHLYSYRRVANYLSSPSDKATMLFEVRSSQEICELITLINIPISLWKHVDDWWIDDNIQILVLVFVKLHTIDHINCVYFAMSVSCGTQTSRFLFHFKYLLARATIQINSLFCLLPCLHLHLYVTKYALCMCFRLLMFNFYLLSPLLVC